MESKWKNKSFISALKNSINGIKYIFINERNFRIQLILAILSLILGLILKISVTEYAIIILVIFLVLLAESINTVIEVIVDMYTEEYNEKAKIAKDVSSAAVTLIAICSIIIGIAIYLPAFLSYNYLLNR